jgi:hypothetical protein
MARLAAALALAVVTTAARAADAPSDRWGSFEIGAGTYIPNIDAGVASPGPFGGPYEEIFGKSQRWMFRLGAGKTIWHGIGDLEVGLRTGVFRATGNAIQEGTGTSPTNPPIYTGNTTSITIIPTSLTLTYYFDWIAERYRFLPFMFYGRAALERYNWWVNGPVSTGREGTVGRGATNGWSVTGGVALLLDVLDPGMARDLDRDTGINHTYLFFDVTKQKVDDFGSSKSWDLSRIGPAYAFGLMFAF